MSGLPGEWSARRRLVLALSALVGTALVVLAVAAFLGRSDEGSGVPLEPMRGPDPGMGSVFALGVDPTDDDIYAGARFGLFSITADGEATRVGNRQQETHAIAVVGPDQMLASGHPDSREDLPTKLGLIESRNGGQTWAAVSLAGEADFHVLRVRHGQVYGYDSGSQRFMVSADRVEWDFRAVLPMADFVVSPVDADLVLGVSEQSLVRSVDGGRTFTTEDGARNPAVLAWPGKGELYAVTGDGHIQHSTDRGLTWTFRGQVDGVPQAMLAADESHVYVATDTGIYVSDDGARTFALLYRDR